MKLSCWKVHEKVNLFASSACVVEKSTVFWINKILLVNQDCVDSLSFVASQSEATIDRQASS